MGDNLFGPLKPVLNALHLGTCRDHSDVLDLCGPLRPPLHAVHGAEGQADDPALIFDGVVDMERYMGRQEVSSHSS